MVWEGRSREASPHPDSTAVRAAIFVLTIERRPLYVNLAGPRATSRDLPVRNKHSRREIDPDQSPPPDSFEKAEYGHQFSAKLLRSPGLPTLQC